MFTIAMGLMGTFYCGMKCNGLDLCPNYAGTLMAVVNGVGAISGIITPYLISALTPDVSSMILFFTFKVFLANSISLFFFIKNEVSICFLAISLK